MTRSAHLLTIPVVLAVILLDPEPLRGQVRHTVQISRLAPHDFPYFSMSVPSHADVHLIGPQVAADSVATFLVRDSLSSTYMFVTSFRLPKGKTLRDMVRQAFLEDSTVSANNDEGVSGPIRPTHLGPWPAWRFGDSRLCDGFTVYAAHRGAAVAITCQVDTSLPPRQLAVMCRNYARMLATFRWRGA